MSLEIYKLYNNQEKAISKFELIHEGVLGNIRIEPYLIKNNANDFKYKNIVLSVKATTENEGGDFVFKIIKSETEPTEEMWDSDNDVITISSMSVMNDPEENQFKFWVRTFVQTNVHPGLYLNKLKLELSYEMSDANESI